MLQGIIRCLGPNLLIEDEISSVEHPAIPSVHDPAWGHTDAEAGLLYGPSPSALCLPDEVRSSCLQSPPLRAWQAAPCHLQMVMKHTR